MGRPMWLDIFKPTGPPAVFSAALFSDIHQRFTWWVAIPLDGLLLLVSLTLWLCILAYRDNWHNDALFLSASGAALAFLICMPIYHAAVASRVAHGVTLSFNDRLLMLGGSFASVSIVLLVCIGLIFLLGWIASRVIRRDKTA